MAKRKSTKRQTTIDKTYIVLLLLLFHTYEDTIKEVIRKRKWRDRQQNVQMKTTQCSNENNQRSTKQYTENNTMF